MNLILREKFLEFFKNMTNYLPIEIDRVYAITLNPPSKFELGDSNDKELKKNSKKKETNGDISY